MKTQRIPLFVYGKNKVEEGIYDEETTLIITIGLLVLEDIG